MRRFLATAVLAGFCLVLVGCGGSASTTPTGTELKIGKDGKDIKKKGLEGPPPIEPIK